jgi:transposase-like protein
MQNSRRKVEEFLKHPIEEKIRYLLVDAIYFKVRCGAQYKNRALLVVVGIHEDGLREILGASIAESAAPIKKEIAFINTSF